MALSSRIKHVLQCICLFSWVFIFCYVSGGIRFGEDPVDHIDPWTSYGTLVTLVLMLVRLFALLALPQTLCNEPCCTCTLFYNKSCTFSSHYIGYISSSQDCDDLF